MDSPGGGRNAPFVILVLLFALLLPGGAVAAAPSGAAVASAHPLATAAAAEILERGGNAFDAAVALTAALAVVEPYGSGLGGGGFWLLHRARDGYEVMLDGREKAPLAAHRDMFLDAQGEVIPRLDIEGALSTAIPGTPAALEHLARGYGRLPLAVTLAPAIRFAEQGFPVTEHYRRLAGWRLKALQSSSEAARLFLHDGDLPPVGHLIRQPDLARLLNGIAADGAAAFYRGENAERMTGAIREAGGIWTLDDLASYRVVEREPIRFAYRGMRVTTAAPPSSGGVALATTFNILAGYELRGLDPVARVHRIVEALRRAYRDRAEHLGDPDFVDLPIARLTDAHYAAGLRASIHPQRATPSELLPPVSATVEGESTTHFSVLDREGNRVAATLSLNLPFGSGIVAPGTGVLINNHMGDFVARPGTPNVYGLVGADANAIAPGKRMLSSMTPTFLDDGERVAILGTPGGSRIITMVLLSALAFADGADARTMVSLPRYHHQYLPDRIQHEPDALIDEAFELESMGHVIHTLERRYGDMQAVSWERATGRVEAASDPRGIGTAAVVGAGTAAPN
ncbi:MAG: gamma-glutamyltransferase [Ectothiorhodospiraceae bacterium]|jgi:gamma-glutamyltranspeptidase/glutathione hydrolase|nr:gamma-glutamyltransferase [Ectothiorhodospiraceae bacterium]